MDDKRKKSISELLDKIKIKNDIDLTLLDQALIHPSYLYEGGADQKEHNQRLEFLGDAVVGLVVARYLFLKYKRKPEGELTKIRADVVCEASLAEAARNIQLGEYMLLGKGEEQMGGRNRSSNLADCFEALIGALYLTVGLGKTRGVVLRALQNKIKDSVAGQRSDFKSQLQEYIQKEPANRLVYKIIREEGPQHEKTFYAAVFLNEEKIAEGSGHTKKEAEQQAARAALLKLGEI